MTLYARFPALVDVQDALLLFILSATRHKLQDIFTEMSSFCSVCLHLSHLTATPGLHLIIPIHLMVSAFCQTRLYEKPIKFPNKRPNWNFSQTSAGQTGCLVNGGFIETKGNREFTSSWTHRRCDRGGRWSWCADRAHADWRGKNKKLKTNISFIYSPNCKWPQQISYPQKCRRPRWARIFFSLSRSSLSLLSRPLASTWHHAEIIILTIRHHKNKCLWCVSSWKHFKSRLLNTIQLSAL